MPEHYSGKTISAEAWCKPCKKRTQHRIDNHRIGPCLDCIDRLTIEHAQLEIDRRREARQGELFV